MISKLSTQVWTKLLSSPELISLNSDTTVLVMIQCLHIILMCFYRHADAYRIPYPHFVKLMICLIIKFKKLGKIWVLPCQKTVAQQSPSSLPHFPSAGQPENMRKRARADKGKAGAGMSGNKQGQPLGLKITKILLGAFFLCICSHYIGFYHKH